MKVLVSTNQTQGRKGGDFCFVPEGEIVTFGFECDGETVDGSCGCKRSMIGVSCLKGTTTMKVVDLDMAEEDLVSTFIEHLKRAGWGTASSSELRRIAESDVDALVRGIDAFVAGTIIERRGPEFLERRKA